MSMNKRTAMEPMIKDLAPAFIESSPSEGPMVLSSTIFRGAGNAPAFNTIASAFASSTVEFPISISDLPLGILSLTTGADWTISSRTIAILFPIFAPVIIAHFPLALLVMVSSTFTPDGLFGVPTPGTASRIASPVRSGSDFTR